MTHNYVIATILLLSLAASAAAANDTGIASVDDLKERIADAGATWKAGETSVSELSDEEKRHLCGAFVTPPRGEPSLAPVGGVCVPDAWDWRDVEGDDFMTPVKSQGSCGSCWAFGAVGAVEAQINIANDNPDIDVDLSEQHLVSACSRAGDCAGGWPTTALRYIETTGIPAEECSPYLAQNSACAPCDDWYNVSLRYYINNYQQVGSTTDDYKYAIWSRGPIVTIMRTPDDWFYYTGGVYSSVMDSNLLGSPNHCVVVVGWNDTEGCWIIKNSWGTGWGEGGYGRIAYGVLEGHRYGYAIIEPKIPSAPVPELPTCLMVAVGVLGIALCGRGRD